MFYFTDIYQLLECVSILFLLYRSHTQMACKRGLKTGALQTNNPCMYLGTLSLGEGLCISFRQIRKSLDLDLVHRTW